MVLTPEMVVEKKFQATKFREGYDQDEVDEFLDEVVSELTRLTNENDELRKKLSACERRVGELTRSTATGAQPVVQSLEQERPAAAATVASDAVDSPATVGATASNALAGVAALSGRNGPNSEAATGMLALAQKLHDEHVRSGEQKRDRLVAEAEQKATRLINEAQTKHRETLGSLERERSLLERKIEELRSFERDYRSRLKSYLETQLRDLESKGSIVPNRPSGSADATSGLAT